MYYFIVDNYINGDPKEYATYIEHIDSRAVIVPGMEEVNESSSDQN